MREDTIADALLSELAHYLNANPSSPLGDGTVTHELIDVINDLRDDDGDDNAINLHNGYYFRWDITGDRLGSGLAIAIIFFVIERESYIVMIEPKSHTVCFEGHLTCEDGVYSLTRSEVAYSEPERVNSADNDTRTNILLKMIMLRNTVDE